MDFNTMSKHHKTYKEVNNTINRYIKYYIVVYFSDI